MTEIQMLKFALVTYKNEEYPIKYERSQDFPHYNPMRAICCHGNQSSDPIRPKPNAAFLHPNDNPDEFFDFDQPAGLRDIHV